VRLAGLDMTRQKPRTLIFDLGGVLVDVRPREMLQRLAREAGCTPEQLEAVLLDPQLLHPLELGHTTPEQYFQRLTARVPLRLAFQEFIQAWNSILSENASHTQMFQRLSSRYTVVVLTNTNVLHDQFIRRSWPVLERAHHWIASYQVGLRKPDPAIFQLALQQAQAEPASTVYVDDVQEHIQSARHLGVGAIQFTEPMCLADELRAVGVQW